MGNDRPDVSVVIPCYNAARTIGECIASAAAQTLTNIEIIVVDDGSTDGSSETIRAMATEDRRIIFLRQENRGPGAARNLGISRARGRYVAFLDADDAWKPPKLAVQIAAMEKIGVVMSGLRINQRRSVESRPYARNLFSNRFVTSSVMVRRTELTGGLRFAEHKKFSEDFYLWQKIIARYPAATIHDDSLMRRVGFGDTLSAKFWRMEMGELDTLSTLRKERIADSANTLITLAAMFFSFAKYLRREIRWAISVLRT
jgi:glycosyltransferase involved in cell wall biosynthesis